ncbi:MAG TPA: acetyl-CoA carboxylase carboxyltransferase subunit alpha [Acidobacteriota bacterium]|nr:acetyl-CoA carboxylase carboxyltransferase subunit alpha [Acidobacteriota bacterium]HNR39928.1 acetyl-CoA carboxylase carboxyltransferase subunit alpha [Acidobacteriota bacterium]HNU02148.1 acetyl-CoA carboxylase carboxyltransferase subunit alpha [Acidobacteriota bacterium]HPB27032.1 acetyl-CoA carboxylase carboxyltransferase subunit alpha [Acidobacteriota bacterium]HQO25093.1 acetyl-CoA carboxylase carboxyltransferase subunit alpha [Acidobacteriota bacterium]
MNDWHSALLKDLESQLAELERFGDDESARRALEILREKIRQVRGRIYEQITPWQRIKLARHENRPYSLDLVERLVTDFEEIHGDRKYADDPAVITGFGWFRTRPVVVVGQQKGRNLAERKHRNFGMMQPEGYRKALRAMRLAEKFRKPILTFIDTPGAFPGIGAEERGQAEAIAYNLREMARLRVPVVVSVIGEGGSGGALGIGVGDRILMLENAVYSVISPESCSAILWKDQGHAEAAAHNLGLTSRDLKRLGIIDEIVPEPPEGAHTDWDATARALGDAVERHLTELMTLPFDGLPLSRTEKFRRMGVVEPVASS